MSAPPYMPLYVADYLADTTHLDGVASGAYLHLLMAMWRAGGKLPAGDEKLRATTKLTSRQWEAVRLTVLELFIRRGNSLSHKRLSKELAKYRDKSVRLSEAGKRGQAEKQRKNKHKGISQAKARLKPPLSISEPEVKKEGLIDNPSLNLSASDAARLDGAAPLRAPVLRVIEKPDAVARQAQIAEVKASLGIRTR